MSYLIDLVIRLAHGTTGWPDTFRQRHADYLLSAMRDDGGFAGRQGDSDLYYTSFGLQGLALLGELDEPVAIRAADFLRSQLDRELSGIELYSLVFSAMLLKAVCEVDVLGDGKDALVAAIDRHRHRDGGFAKRPEQPASSTYHTFLAVSCRELLGAEPAAPEPIVALVCSRRRDDGGYVEVPQMRASGTNPTVAAVVLLKMLGRLGESTQIEATRFLAAVQNEEGGFRANMQIPVADLLSTFTAVVALAAIGQLSAIDARAAADYARCLERPGGGFRGGAWDNAVDVEYTFYGLGTLALAGGR